VSVFLLTRLLFVLLTYFGVILFNNHLHDPTHPSFAHDLLPAWANAVNHGWDTQWYIDISQRGYAWHKAAGTSPTAFFPLYPLLIHIGVWALHRSALAIALLISNAAFLAALVYVWRLTAWETGRRPAGRAILYLSTFPTALFFFAGYTESLFLLLTAGSFYYLRRGQWLMAGALAGLASGTRVTGILLMLPLAYEYLRSRNFSLRRLDAGLIGLLLAPLGLCAFMLYLGKTVGDPLAFSHYQAAWQKIFTLQLWAGMLESVRQIVLVQPVASFFEAHNVINLAAAVFAIAVSVLAARRLPASYALYLAAFWLVTLTSPAMAAGYPVPLISMSRYVVTLFPIFMYLGFAGRTAWIHDTYLVLSVGMLSLFTLQFITGGWII
jgi:Gpi18-like mannosyltransferase